MRKLLFIVLAFTACLLFPEGGDGACIRQQAPSAAFSAGDMHADAWQCERTYNSALGHPPRVLRVADCCPVRPPISPPDRMPGITMSPGCGGSLFSVRYFPNGSPFCLPEIRTSDNERDMDKIKICEAMYALPGEVVVRRRKSLVLPAALLAAGVAILVLIHVYGASMTNNLRSSAVFIGGSLALAGMITLAARFFSAEGAPYYRAGRSYLRYDELYFERSQSRDVVALVAEGNVERLLAMPHARVPAVSVAMYRTPDNRFAAMQAFEYADLEYRPLTRLQISPLKEEACEA